MYIQEERVKSTLGYIEVTVANLRLIQENDKVMFGTMHWYLTCNSLGLKVTSETGAVAALVDVMRIDGRNRIHMDRFYMAQRMPKSLFFKIRSVWPEKGGDYKTFNAVVHAYWRGEIGW